MARGKTASHRDIRQAARRARNRSRGEILVAVSIALSVLAVIVIMFAGGHRASNPAVAIGGATSGASGAPGATGRAPDDLTATIEDADRAWLKDVGAGRVVSADDGSDALSLPNDGRRDHDAGTASRQSGTKHSSAPLER
jgi:hypothetical protein